MMISDATIDEARILREDAEASTERERQVRAVAEAVLAVYRAGWRRGLGGYSDDEVEITEEAAKVFGESLLASGTAAEPEELRRILGLV